METLNEAVALRDEFRRAAALAFTRHLSRTSFPAPVVEWFKTLHTSEEVEAAMIWVLDTWATEEKAACEKWLKYHRIVAELELAGFVKSEQGVV